MNTIIKSRDTCENALLSLGLTPLNLLVNKNNRPAGCYWKSDGNGFFNYVVDPSLTDPNSFGERGGVCRTIGAKGKNFNESCSNFTRMIAVSITLHHLN